MLVHFLLYVFAGLLFSLGVMYSVALLGNSRFALWGGIFAGMVQLLGDNVHGL